MGQHFGHTNGRMRGRKRRAFGKTTSKGVMCNQQNHDLLLYPDHRTEIDRTAARLCCAAMSCDLRNHNGARRGAGPLQACWQKLFAPQIIPNGLT